MKLMLTKIVQNLRNKKKLLGLNTTSLKIVFVIFIFKFEILLRIYLILVMVFQNDLYPYYSLEENLLVCFNL